MFRTKIGIVNPYMVMVITQVVFAIALLANEILAMNNRVPGGNYPFEIKYSWTRVLLFFGGAIVVFLLAWVSNSENRSFFRLPSIPLVLTLAIPPTLLGLFSNYLAFMGWCCEQPFGFYFGFPFSFVLGIAGFDPSILEYANYGLVNILTTSAFTLNWQFVPYKFFLNFLFWSNMVFGFLSLISWYIQREKVAQQVTEYLQPERN